MSERPRQSDTERHGPGCPRCGYDQSGEIATWERVCPLEGVCSECGLAFRWRQVLARGAVGPRWSVEHGLELTVGRILRAYCRAIVHGRMWQQLELTSLVRPRRLVWFLLVTALIHHIAIAAAVSASRITTPMLQTGAVFHDVTFVDVLFPYASDFEFPSGGWATSVYPVWWGCALGGVGFVVPALTMLVFLESMSRIGVKPVLLVRGAAYMQPAVLTVSMVFLAVIALGDWWASNGPPGAALEVTALIALVFVGWPVVQTLRWRAFIRHHLELPHSWWIALSMLVIVLLAQLVTFLLLNQWIGR